MSRILILEDSPTQAARLRMILESEGYVVEHAQDAESGLAMAAGTAFDLVVSDVVMPGQSGYDFCRQVKRNGLSAGAPVILLTSLDDPMAIIEGLACGADNFLTKPYEPAEIVARVEKLLHNRSLRDENKVRLGVEVAFLGKRFTITSDKEQIVDLLISTFEDVVRANAELQQSRSELAAAKADLEHRVQERTKELRGTNALLERSLLDLRESESRFRSIADTMPALLWMSDERGDCTFVNQRWTEYTGRSVDQELGQGFLDSIHPSHREESGKADRKFAKMPSSFVGEYQLRGGGGDYRWFLDTSVPRFSGDGRYLGHVGVLIDIDDRRGLEAQLRQAQKMEAVGQLTGGIAHDFNNLLTIIIGYTEILGTTPGLSDQARKQIETVDAAATRASDLTRRLLAFSRRQALLPKRLNLNELMEGIETLLVRTLGASVEIQSIRGADLWNCFVDPAQVEAAIINLAVNARDAMPEGGKLTIETANVLLDEDYAAVNVDVQAGPYVLISVTDTGIGMTPEVQARVFEPFFTTKEIGKGTGLGLSMVYGFVKQSSGHIKTYSEVGHGTSIKLYLPRIEPAADETTATTTARSTALPTGTEKILVVEDDTTVREYIVVQLASLGYTVEQAPSGQAALQMLPTMQPVDLLLTDMVMPGGVSGRQLADHATQRWKGLKVLFVSGYPEHSAVQHGRLDPGLDLLGKPFNKRTLAVRVRAALDRTPAATAAK